MKKEIVVEKKRTQLTYSKSKFKQQTNPNIRNGIRILLVQEL